jgi:negative regulator of sigma E activity
MSQIPEEQLSAFLDGEPTAEEAELLLARLDREPARRATLARYAMIGECLRSGSASLEALDIAEQVRAALLADAQPVPIRLPVVGRPGRGWLAGGIAAAAAVVAILIAGPKAWFSGNEPAASRDTATLALLDEPVTGITTPVANHRLSPRAVARLTGYLVAHGEYANQLSRSTFDSHLVSGRAERASWRQPQDSENVR